MSLRIWRKNANKFPTLAHLKVGEMWRNVYGEKMQ